MIMNELKQVAIRMVDNPPLYSDSPMDCPESAIKVISDMLEGMDREYLGVINLTSNLMPINFNIVSIGDLNNSIANPREILKTSILSNASCIMLFHNHPSGSVEPSKADITTTERIKQACELMGIKFLDHLVIGKHGQYHSIMTSEFRNANDPSIRTTETVADYIRKYNAVAEKGSRQEKLKELSDKLEAGVKAVFNSDTFMNYLKFSSQLYKYSWRNIMLIYSQFPDATMVMPYGKWKKIKRFVKKGEKSIKIFAPCIYKTKKKDDDINNSSDLDDDLDLIDEDDRTEDKQRIGFRIESVFDVSQTDGEPLPSPIQPKELDGDIDGFEDLLKTLIAISPVKVKITGEDALLIADQEVKGYYNSKKNIIVVRNGMSQIQTLKTLIHEITHSILHNPHELLKRKLEDISFKELSEEEIRKVKEIEAEGSAFVISSYLGIDTSDYSFDYITGWGQSKSVKLLSKSIEIIQNVSNEIISGITKELEKKKLVNEIDEKATIDDEELDL